MLKILIAGLLGVGIVTRCEVLSTARELFVYWLLWTLCALFCKWISPGVRIRHGLILTAAFLSACSIASWRGAGYLEARTSLESHDRWLVQVAEKPEEKFGKMRTRLVLICPLYTVDERSDGEIACMGDKTPILQRYMVLASYSSDPDNPVDSMSAPGQQLVVRLEVRPSVRRGNPGFDDATWALSQGILARVELLFREPVEGNNRPSIEAIRYRLSTYWHRESPLEQSAFSGLALAPVAQALTLGDRSAMQEGHWQLFRETGTSHLMAISGMHLGIISGWVYWLVFSLVRRLTITHSLLVPQVPAGIAAIGVGFIYSVMAGFSLPTQRAFLMLLLGVAGALTARPKMVWNGLCLALLLILAWQPFAILSAGLWLSFAAVAVVFLVIADQVMGLSSEKRSDDHSGGAGLMLLLKVQFAIFIFMMPVSLYFFQGVSLNSIFANLIAIPVVTIMLLPLSLLQMMSAVLFDAAGGFLQEIIYWLIDSLFLVLLWLRNLGPLYLQASLSAIELAILLILAIFICFPVGSLIRAASLAGFVLLIAGTGSAPGSRMLLFNHSSTFALLYTGGDRIVLDASPGLSRSEQHLLESVLPTVTADKLEGYWYSNWKRGQWQLYLSNSGSASIRQVDLCRLGVSGKDDTDELTDLPLENLQVYSLPATVTDAGAGTSCAFSFQWQGQQWLWLGDMTTQQQLYLLDNPVFKRRHFDVVLADSADYLGALYNHFRGADFIHWGAWKKQAYSADAFTARSIEPFAVKQYGALETRGDVDGDIRSVEQRRFYHDPAVNTGF